MPLLIIREDGRLRAPTGAESLAYDAGKRWPEASRDFLARADGGGVRPARVGDFAEGILIDDPGAAPDLECLYLG